ncbi:hypothetical protein EDC01DRAFT_657964 [Geopyxis carbonaria]|nr:hypothetical protein EDC01DRAFT_657964 [Geopyxis carbonaria]
MLLPSALPCELRAHAPGTPLRRSNRSVTSPSPYHSPPQEESGLVSVTTTGLIQTCRRLQAILSVDRLSTGPSLAPALSLAPTLQSGIRKSNRQLRITASAVEPPKTPLRRPSSAIKNTRTPVRRNKRSAAVAFPPPSSPLSAGAESDNSDKDFNNRFSTPQPTKRARLTTPPPPPNRGLRRGQLEESDHEEIDWTDEEDRQLVEMVLGKLNLSKGEWDECARSLGKKNGKTVGKRWEDLLGNIGIREKRKRAGVNRKRRRN